MRKFGLLLFVVGSLFLVQFASADSVVTLQLKNMGPGSAGGPNTGGGVYVYPYYFSINGSKTLTPLICDSYDNEVTTGESWKATETSLTEFLGMLNPASSSTLSKDASYEEAAWLFGHLTGKPSSSEAVAINFAIWGLFSNNAVSSSEYSSSGAAAWRTLADNAYTNGDITSAFLSDFVVYTPIRGTQSQGGIPQEYIGQVPEPASLALLGSGLLGLGGIIRRRISL